MVIPIFGAGPFVFECHCVLISVLGRCKPAPYVHAVLNLQFN